MRAIAVCLAAAVLTVPAPALAAGGTLDCVVPVGPGGSDVRLTLSDEAGRCPAAGEAVPTRWIVGGAPAAQAAGAVVNSADAGPVTAQAVAASAPAGATARVTVPSVPAGAVAAVEAGRRQVAQPVGGARVERADLGSGHRDSVLAWLLAAIAAGATVALLRLARGGVSTAA